MAISTYKVFLMSSEDGELYNKLVDIKDFPDLGGAPEQLETTTLSDKMQTFINGIQKMDSMSFTSNYTKEDYQKLKALDGQTKHYAVWFGGSDGEPAPTPTGDQGKFSFQGQLSVYVSGKGVNEVVEMVSTIAASTPIKFEAGA